MGCPLDMRWSTSIGEGLDVVELGGGDERADGGPAVCTAIRPGKQVVLAAERNRADGTFGGVGIEFDASIFEEYAKCLQRFGAYRVASARLLRGGMWVSCA